jgi:hypothetical protein
MRVFLSLVAAASAFVLRKEPAGDPTCARGIRSVITADAEAITVCCPAYCGRCNDYDTCKSVNGQDSENACCASKVRSLACENNAQDPYCLGKCDSKSAPCSLGVSKPFEKPAETSAAADCGKAAAEYADQSKAVMDSVSDANKTKGNAAVGN